MLSRLFEWDRWANQEILRFLGDNDVPAALRIFNHLVAAELLWIGRIEGSATGAVWPDRDISGAAEALRDAEAAWEGLLREGVDLGRAVDYANSKGERFTSTIGDIALHVVTHSAYHRGQIISHVRAAGLEPPYIDFIQAARTGMLAEKDEA